MVQPLVQGVRLTALFDDLCHASPLKTPYIYSAEAVLEEVDFSTKVTKTVLARFSSNARRTLRSILARVNLRNHPYLSTALKISSKPVRRPLQMSS